MSSADATTIRLPRPTRTAHAVTGRMPIAEPDREDPFFRRFTGQLPTTSAAELPARQATAPGPAAPDLPKRTPRRHLHDAAAPTGESNTQAPPNGPGWFDPGSADGRGMGIDDSTPPRRPAPGQRTDDAEDIEDVEDVVVVYRQHGGGAVQEVAAPPNRMVKASPDLLRQILLGLRAL